MNIHCNNAQAQDNKAQTVQLVRQAEVNAVIAHCCIEDLAPIELIAQHLKVTVFRWMQQSHLLLGALHHNLVALL